MKEFYVQILETAESVGLKIISDEKCCQLLAWLLYMGAHYEAVVYNFKLNADISIAQDRLNLYGGETPNKELVQTLNLYAIDAKLYYEDKIEKSGWISDIEKKYQLKPYKNRLERD